MLSLIISKALDSETKRKIVVSGIASTMLAVSLVVTFGIFGGVFNPSYPVGPAGDPNSILFTINGTIANDFADFEPYSEEFDVNAPQYTISPGLSNVANLGQYPTLSDTQRLFIENNGFVATPQSEFKQIHEILEDNDLNDIPSFVTSDAVLHAFHVLYDLVLREAEVYTFWNLLGNMTEMLADESYEQYTILPEGRWQDAAIRNVMFFSVALKLIDSDASIPAEAVDAVNQVLLLIDAHDGFSDQWFQEYDEDFSQYVPRGHYTRSELLGNYFKAMMWYGRIMFRLKPVLSGLPNEKGMDETAQAILISLALQKEIQTLPDNLTGYDVWDAIYQPTAFFVGDADDLLPTEYLTLAEEVYGATITFESLNDEELLIEFIERALEFSEPLILSSRLSDIENMNMTKGLRFMGQRFVPDSYILGQLVYKYVGTMANPRLMPKGLDVMAALGSNRAWELLDDQKHYYNYTVQMEKLWNEIGNITEDEWTHNLYYLWLYSLLPLLSEPGEGYPLFMQNEAWVDKQLMTALGSWTELRHDTILYVKQSYTWELTDLPPEVHGYVEPVPRVYARLAGLCKMMINGLNDRSLLFERMAVKLGKLHGLLRTLQTISIKELNGESLNSTEIQTIHKSGETLGDIVALPRDNQITSDADDRMAVIADVHTDINTKHVLEEAVGDPMIIYVAVYIEGQVILTRGGTFSYYEFIQPTSDRLTDEAWQEMLDTGEEPVMPSWTGSFVVEVSPSEFYYATTSFRKPTKKGIIK
jgi:hypothetical protein